MMNDDEKIADVSHIKASKLSETGESNASHVDKVEISSIDPEKQDHAKSDDSEGRVQWTTRQVLATLSLCFLYVGACTLALP